MKIHLIYIMASLLLVASSCQSKKLAKNNNSYQQDIKQRYALIMAATNETNIDQILEYTHPKLFDIVPRELMKKTLTESFDGMNVRTTDYQINHFSKPVNYEGDQYVRFDHDSEMVVTILNEEMDMELMKSIFIAQNGAENVSLNNGNEFTLKNKGKSTYAITNGEDKQWYFIENDTSNPLYDQLIPKAVRDAIAQQEQ